FHVTGVQTCALPICPRDGTEEFFVRKWRDNTSATCAEQFRLRGAERFSGFAVERRAFGDEKLCCHDVRSGRAYRQWMVALDSCKIGRASCREELKIF